MKPRLHRFLAADGRALDVAVDHGFFGEPSFLTGIENMRRTIATLVEARPDAIQLAVGQAPILQDLPGPKPALVLRTDVANVYGAPLPAVPFSELVDDAVGAAVRLDAACLCVNLFQIPGQPDLHRQCIRNVTRLKTAADEAGMPLMVEPLAMRPTDGPYAVDGDATTIVTLVRQAVELGADLIKADPTDDLADYTRVVEAAGAVPVLVRGGSRAPDAEVLRRAEHVLVAGAAGIVYGRNIVQHDAPAAITRALMSILHEGCSAETALETLRDATTVDG
jgi:DhnA family fructose-bisphosphate aldolase class Ia